ncbi:MULTISPECIES: hypothetical protein [unclassified Nonomuraea]|uniref:hypothetical protein n=1 Tax=unclassified Nonomuraea TaxID=2593643 RepID=UPI001BE40BE1|nr:hypothetical protein [Nonomuraea sp. NEAU-A123]MBT2227259.1 hypothetical protein [Nonomuraea sp. NEAU-A123]
MDRNELLRLAAGKAQESLKGGKVNGKALIAIVVVAGVVLVGFIAYRLLLLEVITRLR